MSKKEKETEVKEQETTEEIETTVVYVPVKDLNGMTMGYKPVKVPVDKAKFTMVPGGLAARPEY